MIENVYLSQKAKDQLIKLKRYTGIQHWNILSRWGFCTSLADPSIPAPVNLPTEHAVEMTWKVFGGEYQEIYLALLKKRCQRDGFPLDKANLNNQFRLHVHRGIGQLAEKIDPRTVEGLFDLLAIKS